MKLYSIAILFLAVSAKAQSWSNVHEVVSSTQTLTQTAALCTTNAGVGANNIRSITSSGTIAGSWALEVYNPVSSTNTINCGFEIGISTNIYSVWYGREITAGNGVYYAVPSNRIVWCMTQNPGGCTQVTVTQFK